MKNYLVACFMSLFITLPSYAYDVVGWGGAPMYDSSYFAASASNYAIYSNNIAMLKGSNTGKEKLKRSKLNAKLTLIHPAKEAKETAHVMAASFPKDYQANMEMVFNESYKLYLKMESNVNLPKGDVAGAICGFIVSNYEAVHDRQVELGKEEILTVADQIRIALLSNSAFTKATMAEKQNIYERMATIAAFVTIANHEFKIHPNPEGEKNLHNMSSSLLEMFLKMPVDKLLINQNGLHFN